MDPKDVILQFPQVMELSFKAGHSLIIGHKPKNIELSKVGEATSASSELGSIEKFGLFDKSTPNYNTFYPDASPDDWKPSDDEFIYPVFRLFSETIVVKNGVPIDFSGGDIVKNSMPLLIAQTVNPDHESGVVANALGAVSEVTWQEAYKAKGVKVPAGINGVLKIDAKSNPRIARGIMMDPPSIHSDSVTVKFTWKKSHESVEDFWSKAGTYDDKGELIRLVVTGIVLYHELSLVSHGADPYAQKVNENGIINNPKYASTVYGLSAEDNKTVFDFKRMGISSHTLSFSNKPLNNDDMTFPELLVELGLAPESYPDQAALTAAITASFAQGVTLSALLKVDEKLTPDSLTALLARPEKAGEDAPTADQTATLVKVTELGGLKVVETTVANGVKYLTTIRSSALANYKLAMGSKVDETIENTIKEADLKQALAFDQQYNTMVEEKLPLTCKACSSTDVSRASSEIDTEDPKKMSYREERDSYAEKSKKKPSDFHTD